jgi:hypothetical protein
VVDPLGGDAQQALRGAVLEAHTQLERLLADMHRDHPSSRDPRLVRDLADAFMASASRHLNAVHDVLLPAARHRLPAGHDLVAGYVSQARKLEQALHAVKAWAYGDVNARHLHGHELWTELGGLLGDLESREQDLVDGLGSTMTGSEVATLTDRLQRGEEHAPTRPHPYTPHTGPLGRLVHRAWSLADTFWDSAESRVIPHRDRPPHPRRNSLITRYVMGSPRFDDPGDTRS